jgi:glutathione S-transferase
MADLRIFSYLPNPRLYKATIAARFSGAEIEVVGAKPKEVANWLWDYEAHELTDEEKSDYSAFARQARTGFSGTIYKTDAFLVANPFGDIPTAFGADGKVGLFESNSIMRAAARLGPKAPDLCGEDALQQSRIDGFLDRTLIFARDTQRYILTFINEKNIPEPIYDEMATSLDSYLGGIEQALASAKHIAGETLSLADIAFACEVCLFSNEMYQAEILKQAGLSPLLPRVLEYEKVRAHLHTLADHPFFAEDLADYFKKLFAG